MSYTFSVNNTPVTGFLAMWALINTLMTAGWTKPADSDGTVYSATGVQVTGGGTGANGLGRTAGAWVRLQAPAVNGGSVVNQTRELLFMAGSSSRNWRIKYSASAGFTGAPVGGGSIDATHSPSAADEVVMIGIANDVNTSALSSWMAADGAYRWHIVCGGAAELYSFYAFGTTTGTLTILNGLMLDVMSTGSFPTTDVDPAVMYVSAAASGFLAAAQFALTVVSAISNVTNSALARAWLGATANAGILTSGVNNQNVALFTYSNGLTGAATSLGTNPFSGKDDMLPAWWLRTAASVAPIGVKGCSTLCLYGSVLRATLDVADTAGTRDKIFFAVSGLWLPWSGATVTI